MTEPFETDDAATARTLLIHELSEALFGISYARPASPEQVWSELLGAVRAQGEVVKAVRHEHSGGLHPSPPVNACRYCVALDQLERAMS